MERWRRLWPLILETPEQHQQYNPTENTGSKNFDICEPIWCRALFKTSIVVDHPWTREIDDKQEDDGVGEHGISNHKVKENLVAIWRYAWEEFQEGSETDGQWANE